MSQTIFITSAKSYLTLFNYFFPPINNLGRFNTTYNKLKTS